MKTIHKLREERHRKSIKNQVNKTKLTLKEERKKELQKHKQFLIETYPPTIATMIKRAKRIDPWNSVVRLNPFDAVLIVYYKFIQKGIENIRIVTTAKHAWVEFEFNDKWYIIDLCAIRIKELGEPIKYKSLAKHEWYNSLTRKFTDINDYIETYDDILTYDIDDAKIEAMSDDGLNTFLIIKYH